MDKIPSFTVNHLDLLTGIYVSRKDHIGAETVTTFDLRFTRPNVEPVMVTAAVHSIEHLGATFLRNNTEWGDRIVYFGPMGCRTGFYLIVAGNLKSEDIIGLIKDMIDYIIDFEGELPGYSPRDCGNYLDNNIDMAKYYAVKYRKEVLENISTERLNYPV
ncbi:MAG: S-ribosylhomocysteine lyase [Butyrivibrio sp.]